MTRRYLSVWLVMGTVVAGWLLPNSVQAQTAEGGISNEALAVIRIRAPRSSAEAFAQFGEAVEEGSGDQVRELATGMGALIKSPALMGVDQTKDWWIAVYGNKADLGVVYLIPAISVDEVKKGIGDYYRSFAVGKLVAYSDDASALSITQARMKGEGKPLSVAVDNESKALFEKGQISVFVNLTQILTQYKEEIEALQKDAGNPLDALPMGINVPGSSPEEVKKIAEQVINTVFMGLQDTKSLTISAQVSQKGITLESLLKVNISSGLDKFFLRSPPSAMTRMSALPEEELGYLGFQGNLADLMPYSEAMLEKAGLKKDDAKRLKGILLEMSRLKFGASVSSFAFGEDEGEGLTATSINEVTPTAKLRELAEKSLKITSTMENNGIKQKSTLKPNAEKYGSRSADVVTLEIEAGDGADPAQVEMAQQAMKVLFGEEGMVQRMVYLDNLVVQTIGGDQDSMKEALEAATAAKPAKRAFDTTRAVLSPKANLLVMFDLPGTIVAAVNLISSSGALPESILPAGLDELEVGPSYIGLSAATEGQGIRVITHVPPEQVGGTMKIVQIVTGKKEE